MTKCKGFWEKVVEFEENDDFEGFCHWCEYEKQASGAYSPAIYEQWKTVKIVKEIFGEFDLKNIKIAGSHFQPLIREKDNERRDNVIHTIKNSLDEGKHPLTGIFASKEEIIKDLKTIVEQLLAKERGEPVESKPEKSKKSKKDVIIEEQQKKIDEQQTVIEKQAGEITELKKKPEVEEQIEEEEPQKSIEELEPSEEKEAEKAPEEPSTVLEVDVTTNLEAFSKLSKEIRTETTKLLEGKEELTEEEKQKLSDDALELMHKMGDLHEKLNMGKELMMNGGSQENRNTNKGYNVEDFLKGDSKERWIKEFGK